MLKTLAKSAILGSLARKFDAAFSTSREFGDAKAVDMIADSIVRLASERGFNDAQRHELFYQIGRKLQPDAPINERGRFLQTDLAFRGAPSSCWTITASIRAPVRARRYWISWRTSRSRCWTFPPARV
jgi:hypothetical protein